MTHNKMFREAQFIYSYWSSKLWFSRLNLFEMNKTVTICFGKSMVHARVVHPGFCSLTFIPGWDAIPRRVISSIKYTGSTLIYTAGWREAL